MQLKVAAKLAAVTEITHLATCSSTQPNCNRTRIVVQMPAIDSPGMEQLVLSRVDAAPLSASGTMNLQIEVEFVPPCDLDRFCQDRQKIANFRMLQDNPRTDCIDDYCIDVATIENPTVLEVSPTEGPRSGGTLITTILYRVVGWGVSHSFDERGVFLRALFARRIQAWHIDVVRGGPRSRGHRDDNT